MSDKIFKDGMDGAADGEAEMGEKDTELNDVLQQVAGQLRLSLGNIHSALSRLAPPDVRDSDGKADLDAAILCQSYFRILRLTNNLADAAEAGRSGDVRLSNGDIVGFCREVMERAEQPAQLLGIRTEFRCEKRAHILAMNRERLERLLLNLLSNAFKFIRADEKKVVLEVKPEREFVRLTLTDTGVGMTAEELSTAFDRCSLVGRQAPPPHGLGLGLRVCRLVAEEHGGSITPLQTPGGGTTMAVSLPRRRTDWNHLEDMDKRRTRGFNRILVELSDVLPKEAFSQKYVD